MSKHLISDQILNNLANRIATITETTLPMTPVNMVTALTNYSPSQGESIKKITIKQYDISSNQKQISFRIDDLNNSNQIQALFVNRKVSNSDNNPEIVIQASFIKGSSASNNFTSQLSEDSIQENELSLLSSYDFIAINNRTITLTALNAACWNQTQINEDDEETYAYEITIFYS